MKKTIKKAWVLLIVAAIVLSMFSGVVLTTTASAGSLRRVAISAGHEYSLVTMTDGTLWAWGRNSHGRLGDGTTANRVQPVQVLTNVVYATAGVNSSAAIRTDGTLWTWGLNSSGQLGDGTSTTRLSPVQVLTNVTSVAAGGLHFLAIRSDGTLWAWGGNQFGSLGDGTATSRIRPVQIMTNVVSVSANYWHSYAIRSDGTLWAWGVNWAGEVGDGTGAARFSPVQILTNVISVEAGTDHCLAIRSDGTLWAWGNNPQGALGDGTTITRHRPVQILTNVVSASGGIRYSLAIRNDKTLWAWGSNDFGKLGDGTFTNRFSPVQVLTDVVAISAGVGYGSLLGHSLAIRSDGTLWAWGGNTAGQLGDGSIINRLAPVQGLTSMVIPVINTPPEVIATLPATALTNAPVPITCTSTDADGTIASRVWTVTPSTGFTGTLTGTGGVLTFTAPGTYTISLTVTDNGGVVNTTERTIAVTAPNVPPVTGATLPATALTNAPVPIACTSTDADGTIASRSWTVTPSTGFTGTLSGTGGTLTFTEPGIYIIHLTVTDNGGIVNTTERTITVTAPNIPPVTSVTFPTTAIANAPVQS